jgi:beta-N-acetylhexosaminidase
MVAHLAVPAFTDNNIPASLSEKIVTNMLREELGFNGLIVTDALDMKAITDNYSDAVAIVMAFTAGNDVLLLPPDPNNAIDMLAEAFVSDPVLRKQAERSAEKIYAEKEWTGLLDDKFEYMFQQEFFEKHEKLALQESYDAIRVISNGSLLPLNNGKQIAGFAFMQGEDVNPGALFFKYFAQAIECDCDFAFVDENISNDEIDTFKSSIRTAEIMLFAFFLNRNTRSDNEDFAHRINSIIARFADDRPVVAVVFGNPNAAEMIRANSFVLTFSDSLPSIAAAIVKLSGRGIDGNFA